jgi:hypothetical protein
MRTLAIAAVLFATRTAAAEGDRATTLSFGVVFGIHSLPESMSRSDVPAPSVARVAEGFGGPRLVLAFERASLPYPETPGYRVDTQLVPELIAGAFLRQDPDLTRAEMMIGTGLRAEARISQLRMGWAKVSARMVLYAAVRGMVVGEDRDPLYEGVLGEYFLIGRNGWRIGFEFGAIGREQQGKIEAQRGFVSQVFLGGTL